MPATRSPTRVARGSVTAAAVRVRPTVVSRMRGQRNFFAPYLSASAPHRHRLNAAVAVRRVMPTVVAAGEEHICGGKVLRAPPARVTPRRMTMGGTRAPTRDRGLIPAEPPVTPAALGEAP